MLAGQNVVADQLVKIIQAIQIGRTTGSLIVTRGEEANYEVGTLVFLNGRVIQGRVGQREGREAFNWLSTWGKCRYTFVLSITSNNDLSSKEQISDEETQLQTRIPHVKLLPMEQAQRSNAGRDESVTKSSPREKQNQFMPLKSVLLEESEQVNEAVPYRSKPLSYGLQVLSEKSLSRIHRHVFLLVNGGRRVGDLMRLLKLNENEMLALLYDLQDTGIINLPSPVSF